MIRSAASGLVLLAASAAAAGENVVLIQPSQVSVPAALPGDCRIDGLVREVWAGSAFHVGQAVSITAPCSDGKAKLERKPAKPHRAGDPMPPIPLDPVVLRRRPLGAAHLDDAGRLIWTPTRRAYGNWGRIAGYKTGGAAVPLQQHRPA